jgi:hypothetical protein
MSKLTSDQIEVLKQVIPYINPINPLYASLKSEFPDVFPKTIQKYIEEVGATCYGYPVNYNDEYVFVRMPNANSEWSFEAFKWADQFCNYDTVNMHAYPIHGASAARAINRAVEDSLIEHNANYLVISYSLNH